MNFINRQVFNKKDLADFYNQLNQIYNLETKSFKAANNILQSNVYIKTDIDSSNIIRIIPTTESQYKIIVADHGILNKVANIQCEPLKTCTIDKLQSTDILIQDQISNAGFANVTIKDISINENTTYTINTTDILDTNIVNINLNRENAFGSKACCVELPLIPQYTFNLTSKNNNCIVSPASLGADFDGTGGKPPKLGFKQITLNAVGSSFNEVMFTDTASGATDVTTVKASDQTSSCLYYELVRLPKVLQEAKSSFVTPEDFWASSPDDHLSLPLLDDNNEPVVARGFYFDSDILPKQISVYIGPDMVSASYITTPSEINSRPAYKLTHLLTNADNSGKIRITETDDLYTNYYSSPEWGNENRLCYICSLEYYIDYKEIETFNLNSFTVDTDPGYTYSTCSLKSPMSHFFSGFKFEELEPESSNLVQNYTININTPLLYSVYIDNTASSGMISSFSGTIQRTDEGLILTNLCSGSSDYSFRTEELDQLKNQLFQIQINGETTANNAELMTNEQYFKFFESVDFSAEFEKSRSIGYLIDTVLDDDTRETGFYSDTIYFHGYRLGHSIYIPEVSYEPVFNNFSCYLVEATAVSTTTNLPITLDLPLTMYSTVKGAQSSTWTDGVLTVQEYWQSVGEQEKSYKVRIRVNQYRSIYDEANETEVLNVTLTLPDPGFYIYGVTMSSIAVGQLGCQLFMDGRGTNHTDHCIVKNKNYIINAPGTTTPDTTALNYRDSSLDFINLEPKAVNARYGSTYITEYHDSDCGTGYNFNLKMQLDYLSRTLRIENPLISSYEYSVGNVTSSTTNYGYKSYTCSFGETENLSDIYRVYVDLTQ